MISYSLYLLHQNIGVTVPTLLPEGLSIWSYVLAVVCTLGGMMAIAWAIYSLVEKPSQALARKFDHRI
jgi:peptidoglycan/LPS O-acetylase OafA/YrhL